MKTAQSSLPRSLSQEELTLVIYLLNHGSAEAKPFLAQLAGARVVAHCICGCASVDFSIDGLQSQASGMRTLSDFQWKDEQGHLFGIVLFERGGLLSGLDVWSIDGQATPFILPSIEVLMSGSSIQIDF